MDGVAGTHESDRCQSHLPAPFSSLASSHTLTTTRLMGCGRKRTSRAPSSPSALPEAVAAAGAGALLRLRTTMGAASSTCTSGLMCSILTIGSSITYTWPDVLEQNSGGACMLLLLGLPLLLLSSPAADAAGRQWKRSTGLPAAVGARGAATVVTPQDSSRLPAPVGVIVTGAAGVVVALSCCCCCWWWFCSDGIGRRDGFPRAQEAVGKRGCCGCQLDIGLGRCLCPVARDGVRRSIRTGESVGWEGARFAFISNWCGRRLGAEAGVHRTKGTSKDPKPSFLERAPAHADSRG